LEAASGPASPCGRPAGRGTRPTGPDGEQLLLPWGTINRYRQGLASYYEVLEAQQQLYPAQNTLAQIRRNRLLAYVQLYNALGGGWSLTDAEWKGQEKEMGR